MRQFVTNRKNLCFRSKAKIAKLSNAYIAYIKPFSFYTQFSAYSTLCGLPIR